MKRIMMNPKSSWDYSVLRHLQYYKNPSLVKSDREEEYIMGIFPIFPTTEFAHGADSRFPIDPARKIQGERILEFSRFEVCMHHLSYVRKDIGKKLLSSQARSGNIGTFDQIVTRYENYEYPQSGLWAHGVEIELKQIRPKIILKYYESDAYFHYSTGVPLREITLDPIAQN
jgi:hypothetical protein